MIFAFLADVHLSRYGQDSLNSDSGLPERLHMLKNTLYSIANHCIDNGVMHIVIGGDILHGKSVIHAIAQKVMLDYFRHYCGKIDFTVIDGNHDISGKGSDEISALESLGNEPNVRWIGTHKKSFKDGNVLYVPYHPDMAKTIKNNTSDILISHFGLNEGVLNSGISIISDIKMQDLVGKYKLVLLGHYHKPQEIINDDISIYYTGSPIQLDWGEKDDEKRFLVVETSDLSVVTYPTGTYSRHIELVITNENKKKVIEDAKRFEKLGHKIKVVAKEKIDMSDIETDIQIIDRSERDITNRGISISMSERDRLIRYMEINEIPKQEQELYLKTAINLIGGGDEEDRVSSSGDEELWTFSGLPGI